MKHAICNDCRASVFVVRLGTGQDLTIEPPELNLVCKIKDDYWVTYTGYKPHPCVGTFTVTDEPREFSELKEDLFDANELSDL